MEKRKVEEGRGRLSEEVAEACGTMWEDMVGIQEKAI